MKKGLLLVVALAAFATAGSMFGRCHTCERKPSRYGYERVQHNCVGCESHKGHSEAKEKMRADRKARKEKREAKSND